MVGKGTYGAVISANNVQTKEQVAIKKLTHIEDVVKNNSFFNSLG
jgi:hypothetical protein